MSYTQPADKDRTRVNAAVTIGPWLTMRFSGMIHRLPRTSGVELLTRIAGLLRPAIAVQLAGAIRAFVTTG